MKKVPTQKVCDFRHGIESFIQTICLKLLIHSVTNQEAVFMKELLNHSLNQLKPLIQ